MSKSPRGTQPSVESTQENPSFEDALKRLEEVVESMESGELSLEKLMRQYEEGSRLAAHCQKRLSEAEQRIQQIERKAGGEIVATPVQIDGGEVQG